MQRDVGLQSATDGEFRRASWHMDFIYQLGGIETVQGDIRVKFRNADGEIEFKPAAIAVTDKVSLDHTIFAEDFQFLAGLVDDGVTPEADHPVAQHGPLPRRAGGAGSPASTRTSSRVLERPGAAAYADQVRGDRRARLHLPAVRRHQPGLPQRPPPARGHGAARRGLRAPARDLRRATSTARSPAGPTGSRSPPTCAGATSAPRGPPRAATTSSPRRCSAVSTSTASSSSTTTPARAALSRCGSWPRARWWCSGW